MFLESLETYNFRNLISKKIELHSKVNLFFGANGQGKTNFLEAFYLLSNTHSFRPSSIETLIKKDSIPFQASIKGALNNKDLKSEVLIQFVDNKKQSFINKKKLSTYQISNFINSVLFSPESLSAIKGGPEERRHLIDELIIMKHPQNIKLIQDYKKCLKNRNRLLKDYQEKKYSSSDFIKILDSLNISFMDLGSRYSFERIQALENLKEDFNYSLKSILGLDSVEIDVDYVISSQRANHFNFEDIYNALSKRLSQLWEAEMSHGSSLVGPHKHEIQFLFNKKDSRLYCSQGQQRAIILAFKMAQIMYHYKVYGDYPILLLDDVLSELDVEKRKFLLNFLKDMDAQIILTSTEVSFPMEFEKDSVRVFYVDSGNIKQER